LKGFLPYKSYRLLDTVWVIGPNGPHQYPDPRQELPSELSQDAPNFDRFSGDVSKVALGCSGLKRNAFEPQ
jgi:hypothetical protein